MTSLFRRISTWLLRLSIRKRLTVYLLLGLLPILLTSGFFFWEVFQARRQQVLLGHMAIAQATAVAIQEFADGIVRTQSVVALSIVREQMTPSQITSFLSEVRREVPVVSTMAFALPSGEVIAGSPQGIVGANVRSEAFFREVAAGKMWIVGNPIRLPPTGELLFVIARRVERNGRFAGVVISGLSPSVLRGFVATTTAPSVGYGILDSTGRVMVTTILPEDLLPKNRDRSWAPSVREALRGSPAFAQPFLDRADGIERMGASTPVSGIGWVVNVLEPVSAAMAPVRRAAFLDILTESLIIMILIAISWLIGTSVARPIVSLARRADAVAQGDFSQRMETRDQAELGRLVRAFNNMTTELDRARTQEEKAREQAVFLADAGELMVSTLDTDTMLHSVAQRTVEFLGDIVVIFALEHKGLLKPVAVRTYEQSVGTPARDLMCGQPIRVGSGVVGSAVAQDQTIFVPRVSDLDPEMRYYLERSNVISSIAVPMKVHGQTVGALSVSTVRVPLEQEHVLTAQELARRLGLAMENSHLYEETLEREQFQTGLAELAASVSSSLDPHVVLSEICSKSLGLLDADGVYVWVLDENRNVLTGTSACGFNADAFIGLTLSMSEKTSVAVQAATRREGFFLNEKSALQQAAPLITEEFRPRSIMIVPLLGAAGVLGVAVITDTEDPEHFDNNDLSRAHLIAGYAAAALANASTYQRERRIAETLQRGLLPEVPTTVRNFELANFYTPAWREAAIGGDFYDFIEFGDSAYGLAIGDVSGKGLEAAVVTAMAKYALRAYTVEDPEPSAVLERTNNAVARYTGAETFITLVYGLLDTKTRRFRYGSAGHEPILRYRASDHTVNFENPTGTAAGLITNEEYLTNEIALAPGDLLVMYTDGLTDARSPNRGFLGQEGLAEFVLDIADRPAQEFLRALMKKVQAYTGGQFADDVAVLVIRAMPV